MELHRNSNVTREKSWVNNFAAACPQRSWFMLKKNLLILHGRDMSLSWVHISYIKRSCPALMASVQCVRILGPIPKLFKVKSVKWEKCWSGKRPVRLTFHNPLLCFYGFPWTPSIPVWRIFWPSMHMMWQLEERITDPASLRAGCRKVFVFSLQCVFLSRVAFLQCIRFYSWKLSVQ